MSIRLKMTLWYTLLMVVILGVVLAVIYYVYQETAELEAQRRIDTVLRDNAARLTFSDGALWYYDGAQMVADGLPMMEQGVYLQAYYYNAYGFLEWTKPEVPELSDLNFRTMRGNRDTLTTQDGSVYYYQELFIDINPNPDIWEASWEASGAPSGEMASGEPFDEPAMGRGNRDGKDNKGDYIILMGFLPAERLGQTLITVAVALPLLVILAALGGWFMAGRALAPIRRIDASARDISGGEDLSRRVDIGPGKDEIHRLADTFNGMLDRLEQSFQAERQFTSDASHELRTPTAVILAECDLAQKTAADPADFRRSLDVIQRQGRKMSALIGTLLAYTRREQGTERLDLTDVDITDLTAAVCQEQSMVNAHRGIELVMDLQPEVACQADINLLTSLIQNLVSNAFKYGREGGHVWVTLTAEKGRLRLSVKDDGIGIPEESQPLVWNRFYQVDAARTNADGSLGLGLSMARQIARLHGGAITLESQPGQGSEFVFTMPL